MKALHLDKICKFLAELIGSALLLFVGCMGCIKWNYPGPKSFEVSITFGLVVMIIVQIFGHVSGAHLNPAVTAAAYVYKKVTGFEAFIYFVGQLFGSFMGYGLLKLVVPATIFEPTTYGLGPPLCMTLPIGDISNFQAVSIEFLATMVLILVCCGVWDRSNDAYGDSVSLRFGLTVACLSIAVVSYTN